jgi:hypothetical protein
LYAKMWAFGGGALTRQWFSKASHGSVGPGCLAQEVDSPFSLADFVNGSLKVLTWWPLRSWLMSEFAMVMCLVRLKLARVLTVNSPSLDTDQKVVVMQAATAASSGLSLSRWLRMTARASTLIGALGVLTDFGGAVTVAARRAVSTARWSMSQTTSCMMCQVLMPLMWLLMVEPARVPAMAEMNARMRLVLAGARAVSSMCLSSQKT